MNTEEKRLREQIGDLIEKQESLLAAAKAANRNLSREQKEEFDTIQRQIQPLQNELKLIATRTPEPNLFGRGKGIFDFATGKSEPLFNQQEDVEYYASMNEGRKGDPIPVLSNRAKLSNVIPEGSDYGMTPQEYLAERYRGFSSNLKVKASGNPMSTTADSAMVPISISSEIIDDARALSRVFQAGALTVPMDSKTLTIARITESGTPHWKAENAAITTSEIKTEPVTFTAKTLVAMVKSSVELAEDASNLGSVIYKNLVDQLSLELDRAALFGAGTANDPVGVLHTTGVQEVEMAANGAELLNFNPFSEAYQKILSANGQPNAAIYSPRTWGTIDRLVDKNDQPLQAPMSFRNLMQLPTSQIPDDMIQGTAENASAAFLGEFSKLMVGLRTSLVIEVSREAADGDSSAWHNLQILWRAYLRADIQLAIPKHFCVVKGIIPAAE